MNLQPDVLRQLNEDEGLEPQLQGRPPDRLPHGHQLQHAVHHRLRRAHRPAPQGQPQTPAAQRQAMPHLQSISLLLFYTYAIIMNFTFILIIINFTVILVL